MTPTSHELIAVLPAAGTGSRLGHNGAKELVEIGPTPGEQRPVIGWALRRVFDAGVHRAMVVTTGDKTDLRVWCERTRPGDAPDTELLLTPTTPSSVHTVAVALQRAPEARWLLVYPDILTAPATAVASLVRQTRHSSADVTLALFPSDRPDKVDMVDVDERGRLRELRIKQPDAGLRFTWAYACWKPTFTALVRREVEGSEPGAGAELFFGDLLRIALRRGLAIDTIAFADGFALDIGTPEDLRRARTSPDRRFFGTPNSS